MNEFEVRDTLREKRKQIKHFDDLTAFLKDVTENYNIGYGAAPCAMAQAALATAWFLSSEFGITGFQASFVMWDFIRDWLFSNNECGLRLVNYDDMLYPQYERQFQKTISSSTWEQIQSAAKKLLEEHDEIPAHPAVQAHWQSIADGKVPFGYTVSDKY